MKAIILDGSESKDGTGECVRAELTTQLQVQGWDVESVILRDKTIGPCAGDFFCFIRTPGVCNINDDNRIIAAAIVASDLLVYLTPVTFGGYGSTLKRMVDHQIQNISPFFARVAGETHHARRYRKNPDFLAVGWMDRPDLWSEAVFRHLVQRNALNLHPKTYVGDLVLAAQSDEELRAAAKKWLDDLRNGRSSPPVELPTEGDPWTASVADSANGPEQIQSALLLVGSPKTRKSTSNSLGGYLFEQLGARGIETETIYLHTVLRSAARWQALMKALDAADLVTLSFPIYVDSLPAPVIEALERIAAHRQGRDLSRRQWFTAVANCGFPEAHQTATGLAICETFAQQAGFVWAGGMALGGGGMVSGFPLVEGGGKTIRMRNALDLAAKGLVLEQAIPRAARDGLAKPIIPHWMYWLVALQRWVLDGKEHGALRLLWRKPYQVRATDTRRSSSRDLTWRFARRR